LARAVLALLPAPFLALPGVIVFALGWLVLNYAAKPYSGGSLDGLQLQARNQAFLRAYQVVADLTALRLIYVQLVLEAHRNLFLPPTDRHMQPLIWGFLLIAITLPHALIAWQDPDYEAQSPGYAKDWSSGLPRPFCNRGKLPAHTHRELTSDTTCASYVLWLIAARYRRARSCRLK